MFMEATYTASVGGLWATCTYDFELHVHITIGVLE